MKKAMLKRKIVKMLIIPISIILILSLYILYIVNNNNNYLKNIKKNIKDNYPIKEEIAYLNEYNNYYIFTTKTRVIVLNNEYTEILNESISAIKKAEEKKELIYKTNKLMYEETIIKENNLIYRYYDASNGEFIKETVMEMQ